MDIYNEIKDELNKDCKIRNNRLKGIILFSYSFICLSSSLLGSYLAIPFTFFFGFLAPFIITFLLCVSIYVILKAKKFDFLKFKDYLLIFILLILVSGLISISLDVKIDNFNKVYLDNYHLIYRLFYFSGEDNILNLFGGFFGYLLIAIFNSLTNIKLISIIAISFLIFLNLIFLFHPYLKIIKKKLVKIKEKRMIKKAIKSKKNIKKEIEEDNNVEDEVIIDLNNQYDESLMKTNYVNIKDNDFENDGIKVSSVENNNSKLSKMIGVFDDEIYKHDLKISESDNENYQSSNDGLIAFGSVKMGEVDYNDTSLIKQNKYDDEIVNDKEIIDENSLKIKSFDSINNDVSISNDNSIVNKFDDDLEFNIDDKKDDISYSEDNINYEYVKEDNKNKNIKISNPNITAFMISDDIYEKNKNDDEIKKEDEVNIMLNKIEYSLPSINLLKYSDEDGVHYKNEILAKEKADILQNKMDELKLQAKVVNFDVGPSVTRFEITLAPGVKVYQFTSALEDFKYALGVNSMRDESPIPGKSAIGLEIPNTYRSKVSLKELIEDVPSKKNKIYLPVGKDVTGSQISVCISDMNHILIAGSSGSGKSVCANALIVSMLMKYKPSELRLIMIDPKRVELGPYNGIAHLMCPVISESSKVNVALEKLVNEMDLRYQKFEKAGNCRNIGNYNDVMVEKGEAIMPFIFIIFDEFPDMMQSKEGKSIESHVQRIAQRGRACGIHLILIAQRPDASIVSGPIKNNLSCRLIFRLSSSADSRTVIDVGGAEKLLNNGDMLLTTSDFSGLRRVQGTYVSDDEIDDVVNYIKKQANPSFDPRFLDLRCEAEIEEDNKLIYDDYDDPEKFELDYNEPGYLKAKEIVINEQRASVSFLRSRLGIGAYRATRYIDALEKEGIVGPKNGQNARDVLVKKDN